MSTTTAIRAILFDLGGVVLGSPLHAIRAYEEERGIPVGFVDRHVVSSAPDGAWHRLERGELTAGPEFHEALDEEARAAGVDLDTASMMERIAEVTAPRPIMLEALTRLRAAGYIVAALTNNWASSDDRSSGELDSKHSTLRNYFDHFVESSVVGLRKPDPKIYHLTCGVMEVEPDEVAFLDDIGTNLKSARALGMTTIKVDQPEEALRELGSVLALDLL